MSLLNEKGEKYELKKPNPIMNNQELWGENVILHNMEFEEFSYFPKNVKIKESNIVLEKTENKIEEIIVKVEEESEKEQNIFKNPSNIFCYVLPAEIKTISDSLYGDKTRRIIYGDKFTTEIEKISHGDLSAIFWTNAKRIEKFSIIYIPQEKQWWKVNNCTENNDGFLIDVVISDQTPSFSE